MTKRLAIPTLLTVAAAVNTAMAQGGAIAEDKLKAFIANPPPLEILLERERFPQPSVTWYWLRWYSPERFLVREAKSPSAMARSIAAHALDGTAYSREGNLYSLARGSAGARRVHVEQCTIAPSDEPADGAPQPRPWPLGLTNASTSSAVGAISYQAFVGLRLGLFGAGPHPLQWQGARLEYRVAPTNALLTAELRREPGGGPLSIILRGMDPSNHKLEPFEVIEYSTNANVLGIPNSFTRKRMYFDDPGRMQPQDRWTIHSLELLREAKPVGVAAVIDPLAKLSQVVVSNRSEWFIKMPNGELRRNPAPPRVPTKGGTFAARVVYVSISAGVLALAARLALKKERPESGASH